jgi:hypothetical protein
MAQALPGLVTRPRAIADPHRQMSRFQCRDAEHGGGYATKPRNREGTTKCPTYKPRYEHPFGEETNTELELLCEGAAV